MNKERFKRIIDFMEKVPDDNFDFSQVESECGTRFCMLGYIPQIFPEENFHLSQVIAKYRYPYKGNEMLKLWEFLDIPEKHSEMLTEPSLSDYIEEEGYSQFSHINRNSTKKEVLDFWKFYYENN